MGHSRDDEDHDQRRPEPSQAPRRPLQAEAGEDDPGPPPLEGDFADEHTEVTFADQAAGGPEGEKEPEAPEGYAGLESRGVGRRRPGHPG